MTATVSRDGVISFSSGNGLLSIEAITREAVKLFVESNKKVDELTQHYEQQQRINDLRESCGVEPQKTTLRIKMPESMNG